MDALRTFFRRNRTLAFMLVALSLVLKAAVPTGFMIEAGSHTITVLVCHDASGDTGERRIVLPSRNDRSDRDGQTAKGECPYAALSMASLGGTDPALLLLALAFILSLGFLPIRFAHPGQSAHLRPPLRGPPVPA
ncbi:MAG: hypothetical protein QM681_08575 [Novosphingobium sp.]